MKKKKSNIKKDAGNVPQAVAMFNSSVDAAGVQASGLGESLSRNDLVLITKDEYYPGIFDKYLDAVDIEVLGTYHTIYRVDGDWYVDRHNSTEKEVEDIIMYYKNNKMNEALDNEYSAVSLESILIDILIKEWSIIQDLNAAAASFDMENSNADVIQELNNVVDNHMDCIGKIQSIMKVYDPKVETVEDSIEETDELDLTEGKKMKINESILEKNVNKSLKEARKPKQEGDELEPKIEFIITMSDPVGNIVKTETLKSVKVVQKRLDAAMGDKEDLARKKISSIRVEDSEGNVVYDAVQWDGTTNENGEDNFDGEWEILVNKDLTKLSTFADKGLGNNLSSLLYTELVHESDPNLIKTRIVSAPDRMRYDSSEVGIDSVTGGIRINAEDKTFAKKVAEAYDLLYDTRSNGDLIIIVPDVEEEWNDKE